MMPPAWHLATYGIGFIVLFAVWKTTLAPRLAKRAFPSSV